MINTQTHESTATMVLLEAAIDHDDNQKSYLDHLLRAAAANPDHAHNLYEALSTRAATSMRIVVAESHWEHWLVYFINCDMQDFGLDEADEPTAVGARRVRCDARNTGMPPGRSDTDTIRPAGREARALHVRAGAPA